MDEVQKYLEAKGVTATQYAFSDSNDLSSVCQKAADENDALYVPTDNTVAANTGIVDGICRPAKKPVFAGEEGICAGCGVATLSISYYDLGYTTGEMAVKILKGESNVSDMPIEYTDVTKKYNKTICDDLGLTAPEGYEAIELIRNNLSVTPDGVPPPLSRGGLGIAESLISSPEAPLLGELSSGSETERLNI